MLARNACVALRELSRMTDQSDKRRIRFASIEGLMRADLGLAGEVWLEEVIRAPWASREVMKVAGALVRYMSLSNPPALGLRELESQQQLTREDVRKALVLMQSFQAVEAFVIDRDEIKVALRLGLLQRLRVLEAGRRLHELLGEAARSAAPDWPPRDMWLPQQGQVGA
jgi:hypothetical protein